MKHDEKYGLYRVTTSRPDKVILEDNLRKLAVRSGEKVLTTSSTSICDKSGSHGRERTAVVAGSDKTSHSDKRQSGNHVENEKASWEYLIKQQFVSELDTKLADFCNDTSHAGQMRLTLGAK